MTKQFPLYSKLASIFIGLYALVYLLILGKEIFIPIIYATIGAILLNPLVNFLTNHRIHRVISIFLVVLFVSLLLAVAFYWIITQLTSFTDALPALKSKIDILTNTLIQFIVDKSNLHKSEIMHWIENSEQKEIYHFSITEKLNQLSQILITMLLLPIYLILILYYKPLFTTFIKRLFEDKHHATISDVLVNIQKIVQHYLVGLLVEMLILFVLYALGLLFFNIQYAIVLASIAALVNMIPFIGGVIGILFCCLVTIVTKSPSTTLYLLVLFSLIQLVDKNVFVPKIISSSVQINAFISLVVVIISATIWGIHGMFLSIPLTAILKVIFDHSTALRPWGFLLGNSFKKL
jgi:predicted PurR-regulated permease PerM